MIVLQILHWTLARATTGTGEDFAAVRILNSKSVSTPSVDPPLNRDIGPLLDQGNKQLYQEIVGSSIYLSTCTRGDIAYSVVSLLQ